MRYNLVLFQLIMQHQIYLQDTPPVEKIQNHTQWSEMNKSF